MKTALIIPLYKQSQYWKKILKGIELQTVKPDVIYLIVDRPQKDKNENVLESINEINEKSDLTIHVEIIEKYHNYMGNPPDNKDDIFMTPYNRNVGIEKALEDKCTNFIFIDGDCIPQSTLIESHLKKINYSELPILSSGRRRESTYRWMDRREYVPELLLLNLFNENGVLINNPELLKKSLIVWSCNMAMNLKAIRLLKKFNKHYYGRNEVFSSEFVGKWGGEDAFLGIQAFYCRIFITTIGEKKSGIEHIDHPRPNEKYTIKHMEFLNKQMEKLRKKIRLKPLGLKFFI